MEHLMKFLNAAGYYMEMALYVWSLFSWGHAFFVLQEVVICKDGRRVDTRKLLHRPLIVRLRLFKRSFKNLFYKASLMLLSGALCAVLLLIWQLWNNEPKQLQWIIFHIVISRGLVILYHWLGHDVTLFVKFKLFLKGDLT